MVDNILSRLRNTTKTSSGWQARCPAHDDQNASLSVSEGEDGRVLVRCHAGCGFKAIVSALGLRPADFFPPRAESNQGRRIVTAYEYVDETGTPLFECVRYEPKTFRQRRPDGHGGYVWNLKDCRLVLYHLPAVIEAARAGVTICVVEGEKDVENLLAVGITATCNPMGAGKWRSEYTAVLTGSHVVVIADKDEAGRKHTQEVAAALQGTAASVKVIELPDRDGHKVKDASDWLNAGGTADELRVMVEAASGWSVTAADGRAVTSPANGTEGGRPRTPVAEIATEFCERYRDSKNILGLRFHRGGWYRFRDGWYHAVAADDVRGEVMQFLRDAHAREATRNARDNVLANIQAHNLAGLASWYSNPCWLPDGEPAAGWIATHGRLVNIPNLARVVKGENLPEDEVFLEPTARLFATFGLPYGYDPEATCPMWTAYLADVQPDPADVEVLQKLAGLALIPMTKWCVFFVLYGEGGCGKSVYLHVLRHLVGPENCCCLPLGNFTDRFSTWQLTTHLLNIVGDLPTEREGGESIRAVEGMLKDVADGQPVPVEHKHQEPGTAPAIARCVFATNDLPHFSDRSNAIWDRVRILGFDQRFRDTPQENKELRHQIVERELPGVFNWAVEGLAKLQAQTAQTFPEHSRGLALKNEHRHRCDPERVFLEENYALGGDGSMVPAVELYRAYREWATENGYRPRSEGNISVAVQRIFGVYKTKSRVDGSNVHVFRRLCKACEI